MDPNSQDPNQGGMGSGMPTDPNQIKPGEEAPVAEPTNEAPVVNPSVGQSEAPAPEPSQPAVEPSQPETGPDQGGQNPSGGTPVM